MAVSSRTGSLGGVSALDAGDRRPRRQLERALKRRSSQQLQLAHQMNGRIGNELRAFLTEVFQDILLFPSDVGLDLRHPERRIEPGPPPARQ